MKAIVDQDACISCGLCVSVCPEVYSFNEDEKSVAKNEVKAIDKKNEK